MLSTIAYMKYSCIRRKTPDKFILSKVISRIIACDSQSKHATLFLAPLGFPPVFVQRWHLSVPGNLLTLVLVNAD